jgi:hypothetical protein
MPCSGIFAKSFHTCATRVAPKREFSCQRAMGPASCVPGETLLHGWDIVSREISVDESILLLLCLSKEERMRDAFDTADGAVPHIRKFGPRITRMNTNKNSKLIRGHSRNSRASFFTF